jgi:hypothetical protein
VPPDREAAIMTRVLAYDRNLKGRAGGSVILAVLERAGNSASQQEAQRIHAAFKKLEKFTIQNLPFKAIRVPYTGESELVSVIASRGIDAVYVPSALAGDAAAVGSACRKRRALSLAGDGDMLKKGLAIAVDIRDTRPQLIIHLRESQAVGSSFPSALLRLADVVR